MPNIQIECSPCNGTGLYCGFAEPKGTAVICHGCDGSGKTMLSYREFTGRKRKRNIQHVLVQGNGPLGWTCRTGNEKTIPIKEFYNTAR